MNIDLLNVLGLAAIGSVAGLIGTFLFLVNKKLAKGLSKVAVPLATGILLSLSFLHLLPESVELLEENAYMLMLTVFVVLFIIERFFFHLHHHDEDSVRRAVPLVIFGDTIHNFLDGAAIASAYIIDPTLGLTVALATFLHETPHEIADFGILLSAGWKTSKAFWANLFSALATFPGALIAYYFSTFIENSEGIFICLAAGLFLYIAATDFLPEVGHEHGKFSLRQVIYFLLGIAIIVIMRAVIPEFH